MKVVYINVKLLNANISNQSYIFIIKNNENCHDKNAIHKKNRNLWVYKVIFIFFLFYNPVCNILLRGITLVEALTRQQLGSTIFGSKQLYGILSLYMDVLDYMVTYGCIYIKMDAWCPFQISLILAYRCN